MVIEPRIATVGQSFPKKPLKCAQVLLECPILVCEQYNGFIYIVACSSGGRWITGENKWL